MEVFTMQMLSMGSELKTRAGGDANAELHFCRSALVARGGFLASRGALESAAGDVWMGGDAADAVKSCLAGIDDAEGLDRFNTRLGELETGLDDLRRRVDIRPEAIRHPHDGDNDSPHLRSKAQRSNHAGASENAQRLQTA